MILQMCISFIQQRNRSVLPLNYENEVCVKEEYTITYIYSVDIELMCIENMVCIVKHKLSLRTSLHHYFIISFEKYTASCTKCVVVGS
jgi:hypothetical protein